MREEFRELLGSIGFPFDWSDGSKRWLCEISEGAIQDLDQLLSTEDSCLTVDLDTLTALPPELLTTLKDLQVGQIRKLRDVAYKTESDPLFFSSEGDGDSRQTWLDKRAEIKVRYPYPGTYR